MKLAMLPAGFESDPQIARPVNSGVDAVASGLKSVAETSTPAVVSDWIETFSSLELPTTSSSRETQFAETAAIQSPDTYLKNAVDIGSQNFLSKFSDLVPFAEVAKNLADPSFDQQKGLRDFSAILARLDLGDLKTGQTPAKTVESEAFEYMPPDQKFAASKAIDGGSETVAHNYSPDESGCHHYLAGIAKEIGESEALKLAPSEGLAAQVDYGESGAYKLSDRLFQAADSRIGANQILRDFRNTIQMIVDMNVSTEKKTL